MARRRAGRQTQAARAAAGAASHGSPLFPSLRALGHLPDQCPTLLPATESQLSGWNPAGRAYHQPASRFLQPSLNYLWGYERRPPERFTQAGSGPGFPSGRRSQTSRVISQANSDESNGGMAKAGAGLDCRAVPGHLWIDNPVDSRRRFPISAQRGGRRDIYEPLCSAVVRLRPKAPNALPARSST